MKKAAAIVGASIVYWFAVMNFLGFALLIGGECFADQACNNQKTVVLYVVLALATAGYAWFLAKLLRDSRL